MIFSRIGRYALGAGAATLVLSGCGGAQAAPSAPGGSNVTAQLSPHAPRASLVYGFGTYPDGAAPQASLIDVNGTLYGTTFVGGVGSCNLLVSGCGTVFSVTPGASGATETVLHSFTGPGYGSSTDGNLPAGDLLYVGGTLYGTTELGGTGSSSECRPNGGCGTIFSITPSGTENTIYSFQGAGSGDGSVPVAGLVAVNGTLYGTTYLGGAFNQGTIFSVTTAGAESVLYSFKGGAGDGALPNADLTNVNGTLYGTTSEGGPSSDCQGGCGTIFSFAPGGTQAETVVHAFPAGSGDGEQPQMSAQVDVSGTLYGTTASGGAYGAGTVFSITASGSESVLYSFGKGERHRDGARPTGTLLYNRGKLYGTTQSGGEHFYGIVFSVNLKNDNERVLYRFKGGPADGAIPKAGLLDVDGTVYGTTSSGYANENGGVFALHIGPKASE